jgi:hypothetical protein
VFTAVPTIGVRGTEGGALAKICPCIAEAEGVEQEVPALFAFPKISLLLK